MTTAYFNDAQGSPSVPGSLDVADSNYWDGPQSGSPSRLTDLTGVDALIFEAVSAAITGSCAIATVDATGIAAIDGGSWSGSSITAALISGGIFDATCTVSAAIAGGTFSMPLNFTTLAMTGGVVNALAGFAETNLIPAATSALNVGTGTLNVVGDLNFAADDGTTLAVCTLTLPEHINCTGNAMLSVGGLNNGGIIISFNFNDSTVNVTGTTTFTHTNDSSKYMLGESAAYGGFAFGVAATVVNTGALVVAVAGGYSAVGYGDNSVTATLNGVWTAGTATISAWAGSADGPYGYGGAATVSVNLKVLDGGTITLQGGDASGGGDYQAMNPGGVAIGPASIEGDFTITAKKGLDYTALDQYGNPATLPGGAAHLTGALGLPSGTVLLSSDSTLGSVVTQTMESVAPGGYVFQGDSTMSLSDGALGLFSVDGGTIGATAGTIGQPFTVGAGVTVTVALYGGGNIYGSGTLNVTAAPTDNLVYGQFIYISGSGNEKPNLNWNSTQSLLLGGVWNTVRSVAFVASAGLTVASGSCPAFLGGGSGVLLSAFTVTGTTNAGDSGIVLNGSCNLMGTVTVAPGVPFVMTASDVVNCSPFPYGATWWPRPRIWPWAT